jgi:hypothetical protein
MTLAHYRDLPFNPNLWYQEHEPNKPMRYQVMVRRVDREKDQFEHLIGSIVTHMALEDYCDLHGLFLYEKYRGTRTALPHERTELF